MNLIVAVAAHSYPQKNVDNYGDKYRLKYTKFSHSALIIKKPRDIFQIFFHRLSMSQYFYSLNLRGPASSAGW